MADVGSVLDTLISGLLECFTPKERRFASTRCDMLSSSKYVTNLRSLPESRSKLIMDLNISSFLASLAAITKQVFGNRYRTKKSHEVLIQLRLTASSGNPRQTLYYIYRSPPTISSLRGGNQDSTTVSLRR